MSTVEKISIALPIEMVATLRSVVESGEYASASEVIREALRNWKLKPVLTKEKLSIAEIQEHLLKNQEFIVNFYNTKLRGIVNSLRNSKFIKLRCLFIKLLFKSENLYEL